MSISNIQKYIPEKTEVVYHDNLAMFPVALENIVQVCQNLAQQDGLLLKTITALDERAETGYFRIMYLFGLPKENIVLTPYILVKDEFPSITNIINTASVFERKIKSFFGLTPVGHPNLRSIVLHENWPADIFPLRKDFDWKTRPATANGEFIFDKIEGEGIYEIPVGPVHAGIIEPGHFRFNVAGEEILSLEPRLGYSHKGTEKLFEILSLENKIKLSERISGDTSFSHSLAFCQAVEKLTATDVPVRAKYLRIIFAELERIANHIGDIGAILGDTGFNFGAANGSRLREVILQINERLTGSRFLRGVNVLGGVTKDVDVVQAQQLIIDLDLLLKDFNEVIQISNNSISVLNRLRDAGTLDYQIAMDHGVTGVPSRAVGVEADARIDFAYSEYDKFEVQIQTEKTGDVYARYMVRIKEVVVSIELIKKVASLLPISDKLITAVGPFKKNAFAVSLVEGWRGEIIHIVATDKNGEISRVDVRDPSFLNWTAVGYAGKGNMVPDFPLINKSFSLSYTGNDL